MRSAQVRKKRTMKKTASYGRIKETTIGGIFMPRNYRHVQEYEKEIIELISKGNILRERGNKLGFTHKQMRDFKTRYNKKQRMIEAGQVLHLFQ